MGNGVMGVMGVIAIEVMGQFHSIHLGFHGQLWGFNGHIHWNIIEEYSTTNTM